ncbi:MAG: TolC family protein [Saprospiraceae bacterium]|nr:TolC family protein [Saprospiraceae bacterium]
MNNISIKQNVTFLQILILIILVIFNHVLIGQEVIYLERAIEVAESNNLRLKSEKLKLAYAEELKFTAMDIAPTDFNAEIGQFNSAFFDSKIGIAQSFQLPVVYQRKKKLLSENVKSASFNFLLSASEIRQQLDIIFNQYAHLKEKETLLMRHDSLYGQFLITTVTRLEKGETDILERVTAEHQKNSITMQLQQIRNDMKVILMEFNLILNDATYFIPDSDGLRLLKYNIFYDSSSLYRHPLMQISLQKIQTAKAATNVLKSALLPGISLAYNNLSIRGLGADNNSYNAADRFSSVQLGVAMPIFRKSIKADINASGINESILSTQLEEQYNDLKSTINQRYQTLHQHQDQIIYFEKTALKNAELIRNTADQKFKNGLINYLEFVLLVNQAISIENEYIDLIKAANDQIISLHYLTNNY